MARTLSFHASRVEAEAGDADVASLSFTVDADGDPSTYFGMVVEDPDVPEVRVGWGDGRDSRDEDVLALASASLAPGRFKAVFDKGAPGPYAGVDITFDELEEDEARAAVAALATLASGLGAKLSIALPGVDVASAKKSVPELPRRQGAPILGLVARGEWRIASGETAKLPLTMSNGGGPLEGGVVVELAGAALERGHVEPKSIAASGAEATFERRGNVALATLPAVRLPADFDVDRKADKKARPAPSMELTLTIAGAAAGSGLFTVRVLSAARKDRAGSAMVGRTLFVT